MIMGSDMMNLMDFEAWNRRLLESPIRATAKYSIILPNAKPKPD